MKRKLNWKLIIAHIFVNALAIAFVWLVPGITLTHPTSPLISLLILGVAFGLLNAFVKRIIQFVTLPFLFVSFGLVVVLINMLLLRLLQRLTDFIIIQDFWALLVGAVVLGAAVLVMENLFGITPPIIDDTVVETTEGER